MKGRLFQSSDEEDEEDDDADEEDEDQEEEEPREVGTLWEEYPLTIGAGVMAVGLVLGMLFPATEVERDLVGGPSGKFARRVRSSGDELLQQGRDLAGRVVTEAGKAVAEMVDHEGLSPDKLARKVKRIAARVKDAVSDAIDR